MTMLRCDRGLPTLRHGAFFRPVSNPQSSMPKLATWIREKDEKWFQPFFANHREIQICNARTGDVDLANVDGLLLSGGSDIAPEFLRQEIPDPAVLEADV